MPKRRHRSFTPQFKAQVVLEILSGTCATRTGAEILGRDAEFGTLEAGKLADVLVVEGDVLADIRTLEDRSRFLAVRQGGLIKAGKLAHQSMEKDTPRRSRLDSGRSHNSIGCPCLRR
jgi:cytosine/adenosine deaminase-related metal-dependent hydrolase